VGLGESWERRHKQALLRMTEKFEVRALYDEVAHRTRVQAAELECDAVDGFTCLVERDDVDAVYVLGTSWCGVEPIRAACRAGKSIFLAKPFGPNTPHGIEVIEVLRSSGVRFMAEFPWRFYPATIRLMELLASGLGSPQLAFSAHQVLLSEKAESATARHDADSNDLMVQMADWLRFVFARDPTSTRSLGEFKLSHGPSRGFETLIAEFGDSAVGQATVRRFLQPRWTEAAEFHRPASFQVVAEHGMASLEMPGEITWFDESGRHDESLEMDRPLGEMLADRFYRIIVHGLNPSPGLIDMEWARRMVLDARQPRGQEHARTSEGTTGPKAAG
jgi:predicted dehydrogenase